jgi:alkanesulfonate monooxygenase SsuD/methylene tetrahydromethanopterin reductase-like flavin-dependent oxidoreductase (luciferase family)
VASARGQHYLAREARNDPPPVQPRLPILIGGGGERKTLRTVARFADAWNVANITAEEAAAKDAVLRRWCDEVGRDPNEIERTLGLGPTIIRDDPADAKAVLTRYQATNPGMDRPVRMGSAEEIAEQARPYVTLGFRHLIIHSVPPHDEETLDRFATEVRAALG